VRISSGVLIASTAAAVVGCASATERPTTPATVAAASEHPSETLTSLIHQALPYIQGKTLSSATMTVPPGARAVPHRHGNAFVYAYVLALHEFSKPGSIARWCRHLICARSFGAVPAMSSLRT
jgi:hypothetical protein